MQWTRTLQMAWVDMGTLKKSKQCVAQRAKSFVRTE